MFGMPDTFPLRKGIVVATHPEDHSVDLVMVDDGSRLVGIQVMTHNASTRSGKVDLPHVPPKRDKWDISQRTEQEMEAIVGFVSGHPVVMGFLYPQISQMTFADPQMSIERHQSDVYRTISGNGDVEFYHPSGFFIRIGSDLEHKDLTGGNFDRNFATNRNTDSMAGIRISLPNQSAVVTVMADGNIEIESQEAIKVKCEKEFSLEAKTIKLKVEDNIIMQAEAGLVAAITPTFMVPIGEVAAMDISMTNAGIPAGLLDQPEGEAGTGESGGGLGPNGMNGPGGSGTGTGTGTGAGAGDTPAPEPVITKFSTHVHGGVLAGPDNTDKPVEGVSAPTEEPI